VLSKCVFESAAEDEGGRELDEGVVELGSSFPAGGEAAVVVEPGVAGFDRPAFVGVRVAGAALAGWSFLGDVWFDPARAERGADVVGVVAAVGVEPVRARPAAAAQGRDRVDERDRLCPVVFVRGPDAGGERCAASVGG
jgi:hypothetical protein